MARNEGLSNIMTLFEKVMGEQRQRQEVLEDRAYRTGMAKWLEEARIQEDRQKTELDFMLKQMAQLETQYSAEQERATSLGFLPDSKDSSEGYKKIINTALEGVQKRASTLSGRMQEHTSQMERLMGALQQQRERIGKVKETYSNYQAGFTDDAVASSIYEMGKKTAGESGIEAMRLDKEGAERAWTALVTSGTVPVERANNPVYKKGVINRAMGMNETGVKQELDLRRIQAQEGQTEAYRARTQIESAKAGVDATIELRKSFRDLMETANKTGDKSMYIKAKEGYSKLLPAELGIMGGKRDITELPKDVIDSIIDATTINPEDVTIGGIGKPKKKALEKELLKTHEAVAEKANKMLDRLIEAELINKEDINKRNMPSKKFVDYTISKAKAGDELSAELVFLWEKETGYLKELEKEDRKLME